MEKEKDITGRYEIGYKKPPYDTRFQPGQSGNPGGRPRKLPTLRSDLEAELAEVIEFRLDDQAVTVTTQRALVKMLVTKALAGDLRAASLLIALARQGTGDEIDSNSVLQDRELLKAFVDREIRRRTEGQEGGDVEN